MSESTTKEWLPEAERVRSAPDGASLGGLERPSARTTRAENASTQLLRKPGPSSLDSSQRKLSAEVTVTRTLARTDAAGRILEEAQALIAEREAKRNVSQSAPSAMPKRVASEPGFVLHVRPWSESSLLLDVFSLRYGRVFLIAKGAKRPSSQLRGLLVPFSPLRFTWTGRNEAKILVRAEWLGSLLPLEGDALMSGFYVNELLLRMTVREDPAPRLFEAYLQVLSALAEPSAIDRQRALRRFELALLRLCGWPLTKVDAGERADKIEKTNARPAGYVVQNGLLLPTSRAPSPQTAQQASNVDIQDALRRIDARGTPTVYPALEVECLLAGELSSPTVLRVARDILREVIQHHLGAKVLKTRRVLGELKRLSSGF